MFVKAWKRTKLANAVLAQVQPLLNLVANRLEGVPAGLAADKYVLGFLCETIGLVLQQVSKKPTSTEDRGAVFILVMHRLFGPKVDLRPISDLSDGVPMTDEFKKGAAAAYKIQAVAAGSTEFENDPDVVAACQTVVAAGRSYGALGASQSAKISGELLRTLFYQRVLDKYGKGSRS
jgi:hypothetical protein